MLLIVGGTLLARGRRTVTSALKILGFDQQHDWPKYHQLLSRAKWSGLAAANLRLRLLVTTFLVCNAPLEVVLDETLERRWGRKIKKKGHWRDSLASSGGMHVATPGLRWLVAALVIKLPLSSRRWALPFFSLPLTTPKVSAELNLKHMTLTDRTIQIIKWRRRTFPDCHIKIIGDGAYSVIDLGLLAQKHNLTLIASIRLAARLFEPAPVRVAGTIGRPRRVGARLPILVL